MEATKPPDNIQRTTVKKLKKVNTCFHSHKTSIQTSRPTWQVSDSEQSEKEDFGSRSSGFYWLLFWRSSTDRTKCRREREDSRTLLSRKPYKFLSAHGRAGLDPSRFLDLL